MPVNAIHQIPQVVISNTLETNATFLNRASDVAERDRLFRLFRVAGERTLLWGRDRKLVFTDLPVDSAHLEYVRSTLGYTETESIAPTEPSASLCRDIVREPALFQRLVDYAGEACSVEILPFATTPPLLELVAVLQQHGITVHLPESPAPAALWLKDYAQTKAGFRSLVSQWLGAAVLPSGGTVGNVAAAAAIAHSLCQRQQACIIKPNLGCLGIGHVVLHPQEVSSPAAILDTLHHNPFFLDDLLVVEEWIPSRQHISPAVELFVPPLGTGEPQLTHLCNQLLQDGTHYIGELVSREWLLTDWGKALAEYGLEIARRMQGLGYCGRFDLDAIVGDSGRVALLEMNTRRTGGTHVHEVATFLRGNRYLEDVVLLSQTSASSGYISEANELLAVLADLLYPAPASTPAQPSGVVLTHTGALPMHRFGYLILAPTTAAALELQHTVQTRLQTRLKV